MTKHQSTLQATKPPNAKTYPAKLDQPAFATLHFDGELDATLRNEHHGRLASIRATGDLTVFLSLAQVDALIEQLVAARKKVAA